MSQKISKHLQKNEVSHSTSIARVVSTMKFYLLSLFVTLCFGAAKGCEGDAKLLWIARSLDNIDLKGNGNHLIVLGPNSVDTRAENWRSLLVSVSFLHDFCR